MEETKVSFVIPAYNSEYSLRQTVDSVLEQTVPPHEVIVINDGSSDGTAEIARSYGDKIIYLEKENGGQASARNKGIEIATGDFLSFLDADDYILPKFSEKTLGFLGDHQECIAVSCGQKIAQPEGVDDIIMPDFFREANQEVEAFVLNDFFEFWGKNDHLLTGSVMIRMSAIREAGLQIEKLRVSQDIEYWAMLGLVGKWGFIPDVLWVGTSALVAQKTGWTAHFKKRRKLCPTVEEWEERLLPLIGSEHQSGYQQVRGRVAMGYAYNHLLAGRHKVAGEIVKTYGSEFPASSRLGNFMLKARAYGSIGWNLACIILKERERWKSIAMQWRSARK